MGGWRDGWIGGRCVRYGRIGGRAVISNSLVPNVVGMARAALRAADIEGGVTCLGPRTETPPDVADVGAVVLETLCSPRRGELARVPRCGSREERRRHGSPRRYPALARAARVR